MLSSLKFKNYKRIEPDSKICYVDACTKNMYIIQWVTQISASKKLNDTPNYNSFKNPKGV